METETDEYTEIRLGGASPPLDIARSQHFPGCGLLEERQGTLIHNLSSNYNVRILRPSLEFTVGDPAVDGVEGVAPLKPSITGGRILELKEVCLYWITRATRSIGIKVCSLLFCHLLD